MGGCHFCSWLEDEADLEHTGQHTITLYKRLSIADHESAAVDPGRFSRKASPPSKETLSNQAEERKISSSVCLFVCGIRIVVRI